MLDQMEDREYASMKDVMKEYGKQYEKAAEPAQGPATPGFAFPDGLQLPVLFFLRFRVRMYQRTRSKTTGESENSASSQMPISTFAESMSLGSLDALELTGRPGNRLRAGSDAQEGKQGEPARAKCG